jgi:SAM-dependent methyltransferase
VAEVRDEWDANSSFWDEKMGLEGNETHTRILVPMLQWLLEMKPGLAVLEIACGNGQLARWLARNGATVLATDVSEGMLARARSRAGPWDKSIEYRRLDATDPRAFAALNGRSFSRVVCNMALMDMPDIAALSGALPSLMAPGSMFVATVTHPVFNRTGSRKVLEEDQEVTGATPALTQRSGVVVFRYASEVEARGIAIVGQPRAQHYFDRTITNLLRPFLAAGLRLDAFEELGCAPEMKGAGPFSWTGFPEIPPFLALRFRRSDG